MNYVSSTEARMLLGITTATLRSWAEKDKIGFIKNPSGQRRYNKQDLYNILGRVAPDFKEKKKICYARVSSNGQKDDLERQVSFFKHVYPNHSVVKDVGSGLNWKRKGLQTILEQSMQGIVSEVVVAHRDRLCRFAFELVAHVFKVSGVKLVVLDQSESTSGDADLADDILSIVQVYACRRNGKRRYTKNKEAEKKNNKSEEGSSEHSKSKENTFVSN